MDIVQQEYIHEEGLDQFEVVKAAFDTRGDWLATVEERTQKGSELEINLKLWAYDEQTQRYYLFAHHSQPGYMLLYMSSYLDFIHMSATGVAEIAKSTNLKGCPHT